MGLFSPKTPIWMRADINGTKAIDKADRVIKKLTDRDQLKQAAMEAPILQVRSWAVWRIAALGDQELLRHIALEGSSSDASDAANCLESGADLVETALNAKWPPARIAAMKRAGDMDVAAELAVNDTSHEVRRAAIQLLTDQELLERIARQTFDHYERTDALKRIDDPELQTAIEASWSDEQREEDARLERRAREGIAQFEREQARRQRYEEERAKWPSQGRCPHCGVLLATPRGGVPDGAATYCSNCGKRVN